MDFNLKTLAQRINALDTYYEMSDDHNKLIAGTREEEAIAHWLHGLSDSEMAQVVKSLNEKGYVNYNRYFKNK